MGPVGSVAARSESARSQLPLSWEANRRAGLGELRHTASTGSTNDDLAGEARLGVRSPAVLVADHQTAGRGRLGRRWSDAAAGPHRADAALLVSFRFAAPVWSAFDRVVAVSAAALDAASAALRGGASTVRAKWPNDLLIESAAVSGKLAGVLSELVEGEPPVVVVGLGLNVAAAPAEAGAVSLAQAGSASTRDELLASIIDSVGGYLADPATARAQLRAASATIGRRVRVQRSDGTTLTGTAAGIDDAGRLILAGDAGEARIEAGDVFHLRS